MTPYRPALATAVMLVAGCGSLPLDPRLQDDAFQFQYKSPDVIADVTLRLGATVGGRSAPPLSIDVGRCQIVQQDDGQSRLDYPHGAAPMPTSGPVGGLVLLAPWIDAAGSVDLIRSGDGRESVPGRSAGFNDAILDALLRLPRFLCQSLEVLPDRLAVALDAPGPVAPAVVELARELADDHATGVVGDLKDTGFFAARLTLTDAGRAKLRAALAKRSVRVPATGRS